MVSMRMCSQESSILPNGDGMEGGAALNLSDKK